MVERLSSQQWVDAWLQKASHDLETADRALKAGAPITDTAAYHCHQAVCGVSYPGEWAMTTDAEVRSAGMKALIETLGTMEAGRFIASVSRDRFDYTEWRRSGLPDLALERLSGNAMRTALQLNDLSSLSEQRSAPGGKT